MVEKLSPAKPWMKNSPGFEEIKRYGNGEGEKPKKALRCSFFGKAEEVVHYARERERRNLGYRGNATQAVRGASGNEDPVISAST